MFFFKKKKTAKPLNNGFYFFLVAPAVQTGHRPPNPAFWWVNGSGTEVKWTFEELGKQSRKAANVLEGVCGLQPGDRMMLVLPRLPDWWLISVACMRTGQ